MQLCKIRPTEDLNFFNGGSYFRRANFQNKKQPRLHYKTKNYNTKSYTCN